MHQRIINLLLIVVALLACVLGFLGAADMRLAAGGEWSLRLVLQLVIDTMGLFVLNESRFGEPAPLGFLVAQILAPLTAFGAIFSLLSERIVNAGRRLKLRLRRNHSIVLGTGPVAQAFVRAEIEDGRNATWMLPFEDASTLGPDLRKHCVAFTAGNDRFLRDAAVTRAERVIVCGGGDRANMDRASWVAGVLGARSREKRACEVLIQIDSPAIVQRINRSEAQKQDALGARVRPFRLPDWAARDVIWRVPLLRFSRLRDQDRVHVVLLGYDAYGDALLRRLIPAYAVDGEPRLDVTVLGARPDAIRQAIDELPDAFRSGARIQVASQAEWLGTSNPRPVTAVFVQNRSDDDALQQALQFAEFAHGRPALQAPIYVRMDSASGFDHLLASVDGRLRFGECLEAYGVVEELCRPAFFLRQIDAMARSLHEAYLESVRGPESGGDVAVSPGRNDWPRLPESLRESNRRAVDALPARLADMGFVLPHTPGRVSLPADFAALPDETIARLARDEHRSWMLERLSAGWSHASQRSDQRLLHPDLIEWSKLDRVAREKTRAQIRFLFRHLADPSKGAGRASLIPEWRLALAGKNAVDLREAAVLVEAIDRAAVLPEDDRSVVLMTGLAPGSDWIMTRRLVERCRRSGVAVRVLIVEAVPVAWLIEDYLDMTRPGDTWDGVGHRSDDLDGEARARLHRELEAERSSLIEQLPVEWIVELEDGTEDFDEPAVRQHAYRRAAAYLAEQADRLLVAQRDHAADPGRPGGTRWLWEQRDRSSDRMIDFESGEVRARSEIGGGS